MKMCRIKNKKKSGPISLSEANQNKIKPKGEKDWDKILIKSK